MKIIEKENLVNIKLAVAEANEKSNNRLDQEQLKHNADMQEYHNKYKLLEELEKKNTNAIKCYKKCGSKIIKEYPKSRFIDLLSRLLARCLKLTIE